MSKIALPGLTNSPNTNASSHSMSKTTLPAGKNPFTNVGKWTPEILGQIDVEIGEVKETTSDFTRKRNPKNHYWKAPVSFKFGSFQQRILKMSDCDTPYMKTTNYGTEYVITRLQKSVGDAIVAAALKKDIVLTLQDKRAMSDDTSWWMTVNNANGRIGIVDKNGDFDPKDLSGIFTKTQEGVKINFDLVFSIKLTIEENRDRTSKDVFSLAVDCSRGAIVAAKQDIDPPNVETAVPQQPASKTDVASEELSELLDTLLL